MDQYFRYAYTHIKHTQQQDTLSLFTSILIQDKFKAPFHSAQKKLFCVRKVWSNLIFNVRNGQVFDCFTKFRHQILT